MKIGKRILLGLVAVCALFLGIIYLWGYKFNIYLVPPSPQKYVRVALKNMDELGLFTDSKEWVETKKKTIEETSNAKNYAETIPFLQKAIKVAGGKHSFIEHEEDISKRSITKYIKPKAEIEGNTLILTIPEFTGNDSQASDYANFLESSLHKNNYNGVIVDLRGNRGGDLSPMVLGLSPLLPDGTLFTYVDKSSHSKPVELQNGEINSGGSSTKISDNKKIKKVPIAVLIDNNTGSSGELTALCFEGITNVKFLGSDSAGYTSANQTVYLYDGSTLQITSAFVKDRTNNIYKNFPISPDIQTNNAKSSAIEWIKSQIK